MLQIKLDGRRTLTYELFVRDGEAFKLIGSVYGRFKTANEAISCWANRYQFDDGIPNYIQEYIRRGIEVRPYVTTALDNFGY